MLLMKKVKAGVLLYAVLMASLFTLILQFYQYRVIASERQLQAQLLQTKAQVMAEMTKQLAEEDEGDYQFSQGQSRYRYAGNQLQIEVNLGEQTYSFTYSKEKSHKTEESKETAGKEIEENDKTDATVALLEPEKPTDDQ